MQPNFFNQNMGRTFPFLEDFQEIRATTEASVSQANIWDMQGLPNEAIVDFGCTFGVDVVHDAATHVVYLEAIRRVGSEFLFDFRTTTPGLDQQQHLLRFTRAVTSTEYETEYVLFEDSDPGESVSRCGGETLTDWGAYLTTGSLETLGEALPLDGDVLRGDEVGAVVEPGLVRSQRGTFLRSVHVGNAERTRTQNPDDCLEQSWPFEHATIYPSAGCFTGPLRFIEGFNVTIEQLPSDNMLTINATIGGGAGEPDEEVKLFNEETPADGSVLLTGGPRCDEVVRSINGCGGRVVEVFAGAGCTIESDPDNHRIIVDFSMHNMALCFDGEAVEESTSTSNDPPAPNPYCGDVT